MDREIGLMGCGDRPHEIQRQASQDIAFMICRDGSLSTDTVLLKHRDGVLEIQR